MRQRLKPILLLALVLLTSTMSAAAQTKEPAAEKKKTEKKLQSERFKWVAARSAEGEQRKAVISALINTYTGRRELSDRYLNAKEGSFPEKFNEILADNCYQTLWAKIDRTSLNTLTPFSTVAKGANLRQMKREAFLRLYEAYEYGAEHPKPKLPAPEK